MCRLAARFAAPRHPASLFARLLVVRMLLQLAQKPALLQLHVEALQRTVDGLIRLDGYVDQTGSCLRKGLLCPDSGQSRNYGFDPPLDLEQSWTIGIIEIEGPRGALS